MRYQGGKERLAKELIPLIEGLRGNRPYIEPFMGGASIISRLTGERYGGDAHAGLIAMWQAAQAGWLPPETLTEAEYAALRARRDEADPLVAFAGFACSFGAKYFGGYARGGHGADAAAGSRGVVRKAAGLRGAHLFHGDYRIWRGVTGCLIYCDPPYAGTCAYKTEAFDSAAFWAQCREWAKDNVVLVSEYTGPEDSITLWERAMSKNMQGDHAVQVCEKLFYAMP